MWRVVSTAGIMLCCLFTSGCGEDRANVVEDDRCTEGVRWAGTEGGASYSDDQLWQQDHIGAFEMHPGRDCIGCHSNGKGSGPDYVVAGTAFRRLDEVSDCFGTAGVTIIIIDARGTTYTLPTDPSGNFWLERADAPGFQPPYEARIRHGGREGRMVASQRTGACNSCHTATGITPGPPGRICVDPNNPSCMP